MARKGKDIEVSVAEVVDYLRVTGQFTPALREVVERRITAEAAMKSGIIEVNRSGRILFCVSHQRGLSQVLYPSGRELPGVLQEGFDQGQKKT